MKIMGQTLRGDLEGGEVVWTGGSFGPVGSPGWRRRERVFEEVVKLWAVGRSAAMLRRRMERTGRGMARFPKYDGGGKGVCKMAFDWR
jgi:hypothetical protein